MTWLDSHSVSERLASEADVQARGGHRNRAVELFAEAAEFETRALSALDLSKPRTLGVTAVSAVSLWYKANRLKQAESIALRYLTEEALPSFAKEQLRHLIQNIWTKEAMHDAGVSFLPGQVTISVKGGRTIPGGAPLDLILGKVQAVQALFFRTIEHMKDMPHRTRGPAPRQVQDACAPWLLQAPPGSYQFGVAIQQPAQKDFFVEQPTAPDVAERFLEILRASGEETSDHLAELVPAPDYRQTFLKLVRNLSPTGKNVERIEVKGSADSLPVLLGPEARVAINRSLKPLMEDHPQANVVEFRGILRALHLERDWLEVLSEGKPIRVAGLTDAVDDVIGPMVNRPVVVRAYAPTGRKYKFIDIEVDE
jgi:hypothetical protein